MDEYDVVIVGGGIHGVGVAQAAAARGYSVLVLEQMDHLAGGTSSRSSKLVHGGLRYLEHGRVRLVAESLRERALLLRLAPDLVHMRWFHFPIYQRTRRRPWHLRAGLSLYSVMSNGTDTDAQAVPRADWDHLDGLVTDDLQAVFRYRDAQTDDALLTQAVMRSASQLGAALALSSTVRAAEMDGAGWRIDFDQHGGSRSCRGRVLVNAAGPWATQLIQRLRPSQRARPVELVQGAHIVVRGTLERGIYYVEAPSDGRAVFIMPWKEQTLVGTTETPYQGDPDQVHPLPEEEAYLASILDAHFPRFRASEPGNILESFAGLRVLPRGRGTAFRRAREASLDVDRWRTPRLLTIWGGKLTTYRSTAEKVMRRLEATLPRRPRRADTRELPLVPE